MLVEKNVPLQPFNTFHIVAKALALVRITSEADVQAVLADAEWAHTPKFVLGGGSNIVITGDVKPLVLKVEVKGIRLVGETAKAFIIEAGGAVADVSGGPLKLHGGSIVAGAAGLIAPLAAELRAADSERA